MLFLEPDEPLAGVAREVGAFQGTGYGASYLSDNCDFRGPCCIVVWTDDYTADSSLQPKKSKNRPHVTSLNLAQTR